MKNSNDTIRNRTLHLPVCSTVPKPTVPPRAPIEICMKLYFWPRVSISESMCNFEVYIRQFQRVDYPFLLTKFFIRIKYNKSNTNGTGVIVLCSKKMYTMFCTISVLLAWYKFYLHFLAIKRSL